MVEQKQLIEWIETIASPALAETWDNDGMQIDLGGKQIENVLVTLDITEQVVKEAKKGKGDFIVSHHPLFFEPFKNIDCGTAAGDLTIQLIRAGIPVYSAHTSFDKAPGGNNDYMAELIGLSNIKPFDKSAGIARNGGAEKEGDIFDGRIGRTGEFPEKMSLKDVCKVMERALSLPGQCLKAVGKCNTPVRRVGLCTGAGGGLVEVAVRAGCDLFITGDVRYHEAQKANAAGLCLIDAGHFWTERIFMENFAQRLREEAGGQIEVFESKYNFTPFSIG